MPVGILNAVTVVQDNNTNPVAPSAGTDRYWVIAVMVENDMATSSSTLTVSGDTDTTLNLIGYANAGTMRVAMWGCLDADFGTNPSTSNGSLSWSGTMPGSGGLYTLGVIFDGVDQTTPFTNTEDDGWSVDSTNNTENCPFTLDEIIDGIGIAFACCSKVSGVTWTLAGGYSHVTGSPWPKGSSTYYMAATKTITSTSLNQTHTFTTDLTGDKTGTAALMMLPAGGGGGSILPIIQANYRF